MEQQSYHDGVGLLARATKPDSNWNKLNKGRARVYRNLIYSRTRTPQLSNDSNAKLERRQNSQRKKKSDLVDRPAVFSRLPPSEIQISVRNRKKTRTSLAPDRHGKQEQEGGRQPLRAPGARRPRRHAPRAATGRTCQPYGRALRQSLPFCLGDHEEQAEAAAVRYPAGGERESSGGQQEGHAGAGAGAWQQREEAEGMSPRQWISGSERRRPRAEAVRSCRVPVPEVGGLVLLIVVRFKFLKFRVGKSLFVFSSNIAVLT